MPLVAVAAALVLAQVKPAPKLKLAILPVVWQMPKSAPGQPDPPPDSRPVPPDLSDTMKSLGAKTYEVISQQDVAEAALEAGLVNSRAYEDAKLLDALRTRTGADVVVAPILIRFDWYSRSDTKMRNTDPKDRRHDPNRSVIKPTDATPGFDTSKECGHEGDVCAFVKGNGTVQRIKPMHHAIAGELFDRRYEESDAITLGRWVIEAVRRIKKL